MLFFFEVMDKEAPISLIWGLFLANGIIGGLLAYWKWPIALFPVAVAVLLTLFYATEIHDPYISPNIWREAPYYIPQFWAAVACSIVLPVLGAVIGIRARRSK